jgi:hypothetical protein
MSSTDAVDVAVVPAGRERLREVADGDRPRRVRAAEEPLDVLLRDLREVLATLVGREPAGVADRTQQRHRQRARSDPCLDDVRPREHVGHLHDLPGVLGVDDLRPARHGQHVVRQQRPQREVGRRPDGDDDALGPPEQRVVLQDPLVGVELLARLEGDGVHPALGVGQLHLVARAQDAAATLAPVGAASSAGAEVTSRAG